MFEIFTEPFMQTALLGGLIVGSLCAYLGVFVVLKRIVFVGIAISEVAALGVAIGLFVGINPVLSAFILTLFAVLLLGFPFLEKVMSRECMIGFTYALCAALTVILIAKNPLAEAHGLNLVSGNLLYMTWADIRLLGGVFIVIAIIHLIYFKEFIFVSFDRETATTTGINANISDFFLYLTIGIVVSVSMKVCGVIFVFASLIIPAMAGVLVAKKIKYIFIYSILIASLCVFGGLYASYKMDLPSAPSIVVFYGLFFCVLAGMKLLLSKR